ncbi:MAG: aminotransferase class V-fold PLP-dependent enzyme [Syntrophobacteraceae bacterium]|nr:aminotransferase class V-fold PLP-dependent enzyme [Syntrophobacteraceae bacterium]
MIYLDNAATSFPKPPEVLEEMFETYSRMGVSPGRGSHDLAVRCEHYLQKVREEICDFFGGKSPDRVVFTSNSTDGLNTLILGLAEPGRHVVSTRLEHNSVLRPLYHLRDRGVIEFDLVGFNPEGFIDPRDIAERIRPSTGFVVLNHVSNVLGTIQPVAAVGRICRERGVPLVLDVSQSAGVVPIDMEAMKVDAVAFTGHKSLLGPTGIGGLVLREGLEVRPVRFGGSGGDSSNTRQPMDYPFRLEPGTANVLGIIGLSAAMRYVKREGIDTLHDREMALARALRDGLASLKGVKMYCAENLENHTGVITCNVDGLAPGDFAAILDGDFDIATRSGLHCAPLVHEDIGTSPRGAVRFSFGPFNKADDVSAVLFAVGEIARR